MEENQVVHPDYQKGFNEGYILKEHMPDLADKIASVLNGSPRDTGFRDGREQYIYEKDMELLPDWLKRDYSKGLDDYSDKTKGKDDIEPEMG